MTWAKFDVSLPRHHKMLLAESLAGDAAWTLYSKSILHAREHSTNGVIRPIVLPTMTKHQDPVSVAEALVTAGLWKKVKGGYVIHDYLAWNPSKEQIEGEKAKARDRMKRNRSPEQGDVFGDVRANKGRSSGGVRQTEKNREEKNRENPPSPPGGGECSAVEPDPEPAPASTVVPTTAEPQAPAPPPDDRQARARGRKAYSDGVAQATATPFKFPNDARAHHDFADAIEPFIADKTQEQAEAWIRETAIRYVNARRDQARFEKGYAPSKFIEWLNAGMPERADEPASRTAPIVTSQPKPSRDEFHVERETPEEAKARVEALKQMDPIDWNALPATPARRPGVRP
jgi:hypothetical protein